MTPAQIAATRHLIGLTAEQLGAALSINPRTIRGWESGKYSPGPGPTAALAALRAEHDAELAEILSHTEGDIPAGPRPSGWYLALASRLIDRKPDITLNWG